jgi:membrane protein implicated in regulation of membrane protease activity
MLESILIELGPWNWMVLGFVLLALEIIVPGVFLLWIGVAALITGVISLMIWDAPLWSWQAQVLVFLVLSLVSAYLGNRLMGGRKGQTDQPLLNRRSEQLIGRTATLTEPIREGRGRIQLGDTLWLVSGPDLPTGTRVRVASVQGSELVVEKV